MLQPRCCIGGVVRFLFAGSSRSLFPLSPSLYLVVVTWGFDLGWGVRAIILVNAFTVRCSIYYYTLEGGSPCRLLHLSSYTLLLLLLLHHQLLHLHHASSTQTFTHPLHFVINRGAPAAPLPVSDRFLPGYSSSVASRTGEYGPFSLRCIFFSPFVSMYLCLFFAFVSYNNLAVSVCICHHLFSRPIRYSARFVFCFDRHRFLQLRCPRRHLLEKKNTHEHMKANSEQK